MYNMYYENGVFVTPNVLVNGDNASITYKGILNNSGANSVIMRVGFGDNWENISDIEMKKTNDGFEAALPIYSDKNVKLAFKDSANNWDNNGGRNYTFEVQARM